MKVADEVRVQRDFYSKTAAVYDQMHLDAHDEHSVALAFMVSMFDYLNIKTVLDLGCGTGRALRYVKAVRPDVKVVGIEPVKELRDVGRAVGLSISELIEGDAESVAYDANAFDLVCEFGMLHHVRRPERAVHEMLRVARTAIFISDANNFGQGSPPARAFKQAVHALGLWKACDYLKTRGRGYTISEGDGLAYSYSVFNNYRQIKARCRTVHILNTRDGSINPYRSASHVALLGVKERQAAADASVLRERYAVQ